MDNEYISRREHEEFTRRIDEEEKRQNRRLDKLEAQTEQISELTISVAKMAVSTEQMASELKAQGVRLDSIEGTPGKNWNTLWTAILTAIGAAVGGGLIAAIVSGML